MSLFGVRSQQTALALIFYEGGAAVAVTSRRYLDMLEEFFLPSLRAQRVAIRKVWFQQDGATAHTTRAVLQCLKP